VTWRDGVHITGTPLWCDARRRRDVCFVSSADRIGRAGHGQLIGTSITLALLGARDQGQLAVPLRQRFTLGTVRLELIPSGRGFGAAALHVDITGKTVLYAGPVRSSTGGAGDPAELRTCDAVVVAAPYGEPHHRFPPLADAIGATLDWARAQLVADRTPVLLVDSVLDGLEVASVLAADGVAVAGGRALRDAGQRIADLVPQRLDAASALATTRMVDRTQGGARGARAGGAVAMRARSGAGSPELPVPRAIGSDPALAARRPAGLLAIAPPGREPRALVWLDGERAGLARSLGERAFTTALVSGRALAGTAGYDAGFVWPAAADRAQLLDWIEATSARDVFVTGVCADAIAGALGSRARVIGPPQQLALFPREAAR